MVPGGEEPGVRPEPGGDGGCRRARAEQARGEAGDVCPWRAARGETRRRDVDGDAGPPAAHSQGLAMLVPLIAAVPAPLPARADTTSDPGAYTSTHAL